MSEQHAIDVDGFVAVFCATCNTLEKYPHACPERKSAIDDLIEVIERNGFTVPRTVEDAWRQLHAAFCVAGHPMESCEVCAGLYPASVLDLPAALRGGEEL